MDFELNEEQRMWKEVVHNFVAQEVKPLAQVWGHWSRRHQRCHCSRGVGMGLREHRPIHISPQWTGLCSFDTIR